MALDFPANPTNGQTFGQYIYDTSIPGWRNVNSSEGLGLQLKSGLIPVFPTSINLTSGSASVNSAGVITLTSCGDAILNGIFTSAYKNYRIVMNQPFSGNGNTSATIYFRFSTGGTTNGSSSYTYSTWYTQGGTSAVLNGTGTGTNWGVLGYAKDAVFEVAQPMDASTGTQLSFAGTYNQTLMIGQAGLNSNVAVDGIQFANNFYTGTVRVYAYN